MTPLFDLLDKTRVSLVRWILFIFVGYPVQVLLMCVYPFVHLYWRIFIAEKFEKKIIPIHHTREKELSLRLNKMLLDNIDDHGAFTMYGVVKELGLSMLTVLGNFVRRVDNFGDYNLRMVSGDVVVAWCFAATHEKVNMKNMEWTIRAAAWNYLKNLGTCSFDGRNNGWVSNRCNNFGVNFCPDSDAYGFGQPMAGPQFYTNSCLFSLASQFSIKWKIVFWLHWIFMGGWYWMCSPVIFAKNKPVFYARDITMKALFVHKVIFGNRWWIRRPMNFINSFMEYKNDMFYAIMGTEIPPSELPSTMNAFFSQKEDSTSRFVENDMNPVLGVEIKNLYVQSRNL